ncbi:MAG: glycoside hydrolase family 2 [bacterium]|nr:glycoside hydrolase family 2 [bacterium]
MSDYFNIDKIKKDKKLKYPNPQFIRENWIDLCGEWNFTFDDNDSGEREQWFNINDKINDKINVPYCYQSELSGINNRGKHNIIWYSKSINLDQTNTSGKKLILNFEACDYITKLWVNGFYVGINRGGHTQFKFDITSHLKSGKNIITVRVEDNNLCTQPVGKQSWQDSNFICWYSRTTGIWQPVWIEIVNQIYFEKIKITPNIGESSIELEAYTNKPCSNGYFDAEVTLHGKLINYGKVCFKNNTAKMTLDVSSEISDFRVDYWTPSTPNLYDIKFNLILDKKIIDEVNSYFGMREISTKSTSIMLNQQVFYQKLILDQGYFNKGLLTAKSTDDYINDIIKTKEMGFNGARKHQKIENHKYLYLCDLLGLVLWAEMPSAYEFNDTAMHNHIGELSRLIDKHYNHPSVIAYTVMNESWGVNEIHSNKKQQNYVNSLYHLTKSLDSTRLVIGNDGWEHTLTDVLTIHDYNADSKTLKEHYSDRNKAVNGAPSSTSLRNNYCNGYSYNDIPVMISEYGGIAYSEKENTTAWGYGNRPKNKEEVIGRFQDLTDAVMDIDYVCGFCYTQLTDVQQEINGLLDEEHNYKFNPEKIRKVLQAKHNNGFILE